jgi:hypothetical protein
MSVSTKNQRAVRTLYCSLMFEARHRIDFLLRLCGDDYKLPEQPACELGYLQLRLICEIIALACLAVHGDAPGARSAKMRSAHEADYILNSLERLHENFYPQPGAIVPHPPTGGRAFVPNEADYMSKHELVSLYWKCGEHLHRGNYEAARKFKKMDLDPIRNAALKIVRYCASIKSHFLGLMTRCGSLWF